MTVTYSLKDGSPWQPRKVRQNFNDLVSSVTGLQSSLARVSAFYHTVSGVTVAAGGTHVVDFSQRVWDTNSAVTVGVGSWAFTAPQDGYYHAASYIQFQSAAWNSPSYARLFFNFSGDATSRIVGRINAYSTAAIYHAFNGAATGWMSSGDTFHVEIGNASGADRNLITTKYEVWVTIDRV